MTYKLKNSTTTKKHSEANPRGEDRISRKRRVNYIRREREKLRLNEGDRQRKRIEREGERMDRDMDREIDRDMERKRDREEQRSREIGKIGVENCT